MFGIEVDDGPQSQKVLVADGLDCNVVLLDASQLMSACIAVVVYCGIRCAAQCSLSRPWRT
eukprot:325560-Pyramimonas_sp.AAC.1